MRRWFVRWTMVIHCAWAASAASHAVAQQRLPGDFVAAYRSALLTMQDAYSNGTIQGTARLEFPLAGKSIDQRFIVRIADNSWFRIDATPTAQKGMGVAVGRTRFILATPQVSLEGTRNKNGLLPNDSTIPSYTDADRSIRAMCPYTFPYTMGARQGTILNMLQSGGTTITSFKTGTLDGQRMVRIKYKQQVDPQGRRGPWTCTAYISPEEGYALRRFSRSTGQGSRQLTLSGSLSYTINPDGIPLLERLERSEKQGDNVVERQTMSVSKFDTTRPTDYWFTADGVNRTTN